MIASPSSLALSAALLCFGCGVEIETRDSSTSTAKLAGTADLPGSTGANAQEDPKLASSSDEVPESRQKPETPETPEKQDSKTATDELPFERGAPLDAPVERAEGGLDSRAADSIRGIETALQSGGLNAGSIQALEDQKAKKVQKGVTAISWMDLSMQDLEMEDILDALLYPDEYEEGEFTFPERIQKLNKQKVSIVGYMIPLEWKDTTVPEFMLVRDLMGCCFGGSPQPDEWISVVMEDKGAEYFPYIPVVVTGTFRIEGIEDEAGYAAGCFHIDGESVEKDL